jgi:hypothetical protein
MNCGSACDYVTDGYLAALHAFSMSKAYEKTILTIDEKTETTTRYNWKSIVVIGYRSSLGLLLLRFNEPYGLW